MADDGHAHDARVIGEFDPANTGRVAAFEDTHVRCGEADRPTRVRDKHHVVTLRRNARIHEFHTVWQLHRDLAVGLNVGEVRQRIAAHVTSACGKDDL